MNENSLNEAEPETVTDTEGTSEERGHWNSLAELLGAEVPPEEPPTTTAGPPKPVAPPAKRERKEKAAEPPPRSHWQTLAGMLGIGSSKIEDDVNEPAEAREATSGASAQSPSPTPAESRSPAPAESPSPPVETAEETPKRSFWGRRGAQRSEPVSAKGAAEDTSSEEAEEVDGSGSGFGFGVVDSSASFDEETPSSTEQDLDQQLGSDFEPDEAEIRQAESKSVLDTLFTPSDESFWEEVDADADTVDDDFESDAPTSQDESREADYAEESEERPDRGRRRRSQQDHTDSERSQTASAGGERSRADDDDAEAEESRERRPRRRRRRRGSRSRDGVSAERSLGQEADEAEYDAEDEASVIDADNRPGPSDSVLRMEASADLFDEPEQAAEPPRRRGQAKRREESSGEDGGRRKHSIPSWEEAVGVIVQSNLDSRSESGSNGNSRRRRGGRRRKPDDRRPRSDS